MQKGSEIRIINFGDVPFLDSQAIYHAVAHAFNSKSRDTITMMSPRQTYVSIGFFQELEKEVDVEYCQERGIPIIRREVGGGAVLLGNDQLFFHFIFNKKNLTRDINKIYKMFLMPAIGAYNKLGLNVYHRPINDLHIGGKKIGGNGAVEIGDAMVVVGSFMFDFNYKLMPKILKVPSDKFRDKIYKNINEYVTTIKRECKQNGIDIFSKEKITAAFLEEVSGFFGRKISLEKKLYESEENKLIEIRKKLTSKDWLYRKGKYLDKKVKITADLNLYEGNYKCKGGLIRITAAIKNNIFKDLNISGDFTMIPSNGLKLIEQKLIGTELGENKVFEAIKQSYKENEIKSPGMEPEDLLEAIKQVIMDKF